MEILPLKFMMLLFLTEPTTESKETSHITREPFHIGTKYCQKQVNINTVGYWKLVKNQVYSSIKLFFLRFFSVFQLLI